MLLNSIPVIPLWVGILLVTCGAAAVIFAKPFAVRALGLIVVAVGVMVCLHAPNDATTALPSSTSTAEGTAGSEVRSDLPDIPLEGTIQKDRDERWP